MAPMHAAAPLPLRTAPLQPRAMDRVEDLLDAAAEVAARDGVERLTTSAVAAEVGASIGTVYRYFSDAPSIVAALQQRNLRGLRRLVSQALVPERGGARAVVGAMAGGWIAAYRTIPSFRAVQTSGWALVDDVAVDCAVEVRIVDDVLAALERQRDVTIVASTRPAVETAVAIADALARRAFRHAEDGDPALVRLAVRLSIAEASVGFGPAPAARGAVSTAAAP